MSPVLVAVGQVVHEVHGAGQPAKDAERPDRNSNGGGIAKTLAEDQTSKDDEVLDPLIRPEGNKESGDWGARRHPVLGCRRGCKSG